AVDPFLTQGVSFSTGGFSAEYGNSLSGVVEMRGLGRPTMMRGTGTAGLAGVAGAAGIPLGSRAGVRIAANRTTPQLLFAVNPSPTEFDRLPGGWDISGSAHLDTARNGSLRVFFLEQRDHVGVKLEQDAFSGFLHSGAEHQLGTALWQRPLRRGWNLSVAAGGDLYTKTTDVGVFLIALDDRTTSARVDLGGPLRGWNVRVGADTGEQRDLATGTVPNRGGDFGGVSGASGFQLSRHDWHVGAYGDVSRTMGLLTPTIGI